MFAQGEIVANKSKISPFEYGYKIFHRELINGRVPVHVNLTTVFGIGRYTGIMMPVHGHP